MASKELAPFAALPDESKGRVYKKKNPIIEMSFSVIVIA